jgi:hypothetical protein
MTDFVHYKILFSFAPARLEINEIGDIESEAGGYTE